MPLQCPNLDYACDPWQEPDEEVIKGGTLPIVDGCVKITRAPGLELDHDQLGKLHDQYLTCGIRQRDDVKQAALQTGVEGGQNAVLSSASRRSICASSQELSKLTGSVRCQLSNTPSRPSGLWQRWQ